MKEEDDPEVQRNGFEAIIEDGLGVDKRAFDDFFDDWFDPSDTWSENLEKFFEYGEGINELVNQDRRKLKEMKEEMG